MLPLLSPAIVAFIRIAYGALMLLTLMAALPHARRYFLSERWGGYSESSPTVDAIQNPMIGALTLAAWGSGALCLIVGRYVLVGAAVNLLCCYYFFVVMRWRSVLRGMGAPGYMACWLGAAVFLLELTARHAQALRGLALLTLQIDFAGIMLSAGLYKLFAGYRHRQGMELGMVNPEWGYWPAFWARWRPHHPVFRVFDEMAWTTEVAAGLLMLIPATRSLGGLAILLSFVFIATQIRLGFLCEMVMICCLLFFTTGTTMGSWLASVQPVLPGQPATPGTPLGASVQAALTAGLWAYIVLLPIVRAGMFHNQLRHRSLPRPLQRGLDGYANFFGLILWRVFTADVVNFFVRVWEESDPQSERRLISNYRSRWPARFSQVAECIALTSVFTTLKYYPSNRALFVERLLRYARTIPRAASSRLVFEWVSIAALPEHFAYVPVAEYSVDLDAGTVTDVKLGNPVLAHGAAMRSPVHEGAMPGSYAPLR